ncbi:hypothetical protein Bealeia2_00753 [Candidatus Bealeia paramacronuclearis]|uniref:hypothetical protein n=1 Tax=Candidatus Bealeia paramacronuclearis TaxID=1921001 RepID=UPI002BF78011|nr:hypothetical protein [Candidatus Bealeia paramacronuclearis]
MKIYFAGAALSEAFDEKKHARYDFAVFALSISQKENEVARAEIKMENEPGKLEHLKKYEKFFISWESQGKSELIFTGIPSRGNQTCEGYFCVFELYAAPPHLEEDVKAFLERQKKAPYWDPLFVPPEKRGKSLEVQDTLLESLYVDRKSWELKRSSFFKGSQKIDLKGNFLRESFINYVVQTPLRAVTVKLKAEWMQDQEGYVDIARVIARKFPGFQINSFSSIGIEANWPKQGQKVGRSGYEVIKSRFDRIKPNAHEPIPFSPPLKAHLGIEKYYVRRHWYDAKLYLRWQYRQKRRETLLFTLQHEFQKGASLDGEVKEISISLQNINPEPRSYRWIPKAYYREGMLVTLGAYTYVAKDDHKSSYIFEEDRAHWKLKSDSALGREERVDETFFLSPRGRQAFEHGLTLAQSRVTQFAAKGWESKRKT